MARAKEWTPKMRRKHSATMKAWHFRKRIERALRRGADEAQRCGRCGSGAWTRLPRGLRLKVCADCGYSWGALSGEAP